MNNLDEDTKQINSAWQSCLPYVVRAIAFLRGKTVVDLLGTTYVIRDDKVINLGSYK